MSGGGADDEDFADAVRGVKPLAGREKLRARPEKPVRATGPAGERVRRFVVERQGDDVFARAEDVSRRQLAALRAGRIPVDRELDLHGLAAAAARRELFAAIDGAQREGARCLLVIHGAGLHSGSGPVLKTLLPDWLQERAVAAHVLAFASAPARHGGAGASLVLLRRSRGRQEVSSRPR